MVSVIWRKTGFAEWTKWLAGVLQMPYDLAGHVIGIAMQVHTALGPGLLESVYRNAMVIDLKSAGYLVEVEKRLTIVYHGHVIGEFVADIIVNGCLILELKAVTALALAHEVQLVNYLTITGIDDGLLLNFGADKLQYRKKYRVYRKLD
jgi:GxxExxY protein